MTPTHWTGWQDLVWLVSHGYEVSIEAGDNRTGEVCGADVAVRVDRAYWNEEEINATGPYLEYARERTFWGGEHGVEGALAAARAWAVVDDAD